jgi:hypothetical protein
VSGDDAGESVSTESVSPGSVSPGSAAGPPDGESQAAEWPKPPSTKSVRKPGVAPAKGPTAEAAARREEARAAARERRLEAQKRQQAAERKRKMRNWVIYGGGAAVVLVLIALAVISSRHSKQAFAALSAAAGCTSVQDTTSLPGTTTRTHLTDAQISAGMTVTYSTSPPSGGMHYPVPLPKGIYGPLSTNPKDNPNLYMAVHSLEHGYVDIWYGNSLSTDQINSLRSFGNQFKVLVISYPNLPAGKSVAMTTAEIQAYIDQYRLKTGPEPSAA